MSSSYDIEVHEGKWYFTKKGLKTFFPKYGRVWIKVSNKVTYPEEIFWGKCLKASEHAKNWLTVYLLSDDRSHIFVYCSECNAGKGLSLDSFYVKIIGPILDSNSKKCLAHGEIYGDLNLYEKYKDYRERVNDYVINGLPVFLYGSKDDPFAVKEIWINDAIESDNEMNRARSQRAEVNIQSTN